MKLTIKGKPKEIAALVSELQGRQREYKQIFYGSNNAAQVDHETISRLAGPLAKFMRDNHNPYCKLEITDSSAVVYGTESSTPIEIT